MSLVIEYKTDVFEGPLDLLLSLISKHKLNIFDINITELVNQYLEKIEQMRLQDMDSASEFLEMASRLVHIKTVSLLPSQEESEKLKKELEGQLIEYLDCKLIAEELSKMTDGSSGFVRQQMNMPVDLTYTKRHDASELLKAYLDAAGKQAGMLKPTVESFEEIIKKAFVSVSDTIINIYSVLKKKKRINMRDLVTGAESKSALVARFLAVLEMAKEGGIAIKDNGSEFIFELTCKRETVSDATNLDFSEDSYE